MSIEMLTTAARAAGYAMAPADDLVVEPRRVAAEVKSPVATAVTIVHTPRNAAPAGDWWSFWKTA
jgi:hypothetical protein